MKHKYLGYSQKNEKLAYRKPSSPGGTIGSVVGADAGDIGCGVIGGFGRIVSIIRFFGVNTKCTVCVSWPSYCRKMSLRTVVSVSS